MAAALGLAIQASSDARLAFFLSRHGSIVPGRVPEGSSRHPLVLDISPHAGVIQSKWTCYLRDTLYYYVRCIPVLSMSAISSISCGSLSSSVRSGGLTRYLLGMSLLPILLLFFLIPLQPQFLVTRSPRLRCCNSIISQLGCCLESASKSSSLPLFLP